MFSRATCSSCSVLRLAETVLKAWSGSPVRARSSANSKKSVASPRARLAFWSFMTFPPSDECLTDNARGVPSSENSDVVAPFLVGDDVTSRAMDRFIVDFRDMSEQEAALYEAPFAYIAPVKPHRAAMTQLEAVVTWWQHWRSRPELRAAVAPLTRFIVTPRVAKHRLFVWRQ